MTNQLLVRGSLLQVPMSRLQVERLRIRHYTKQSVAVPGGQFESDLVPSFLSRSFLGLLLERDGSVKMRRLILILRCLRASRFPTGSSFFPLFEQVSPGVEWETLGYRPSILSWRGGVEASLLYIVQELRGRPQPLLLITSAFESSLFSCGQCYLIFWKIVISLEQACRDLLLYTRWVV